MPGWEGIAVDKRGNIYLPNLPFNIMLLAGAAGPRESRPNPRKLRVSLRFHSDLKLCIGQDLDELPLFYKGQQRCRT
jgi:hypothetical protein